MTYLGQNHWKTHNIIQIQRFIDSNSDLRSKPSKDSVSMPKLKDSVNSKMKPCVKVLILTEKIEPNKDKSISTLHNLYFYL